jgi:hypothetical protein
MFIIITLKNGAKSTVGVCFSPAPTHMRSLQQEHALISFEQFIDKSDHFAKTGSGQT